MNKQDKNTGISWTDKTWNPVIGCSNNCPECWAVKMAIRLNGIFANKGDDDNWADYSSVLEFNTSEVEVGVPTGRWNGQVCKRFNEMDAPSHCKKPQKIFTVSMGDLFCKVVPSEWIQQVIDITKKCPQHIFQFLTQNPARYSEFKWPDNCWLGTTIRQPAEFGRYDDIARVKSKIKFISFEPILQDLPILLELQYIQWVIVGCATDSRAKDCKLEWIESIVEQCKSANVPIWIKQLPLYQCTDCSNTYIKPLEFDCECGSEPNRTKLKVIKDISLFPKHLQRREFPK